MCTLWQDLVLGGHSQVDWPIILFGCGPWSTLWRTVGHSDLSGVPVNLRVVHHKPYVAEYDSCQADTSDVEGGSFWVTIVLDNDVHDLSNVTGFVEGSIYVIDGNGLGRCWCIDCLTKHSQCQWIYLAPSRWGWLSAARHCCQWHGFGVGFQFLSQESLNRQGGGSDWKVGVKILGGTACLVFSSLAMDRVNISLIDPTVLCF